MLYLEVLLYFRVVRLDIMGNSLEYLKPSIVNKFFNVSIVIDEFFVNNPWFTTNILTNLKRRPKAGNDNQNFTQLANSRNKNLKTCIITWLIISKNLHSNEKKYRLPKGISRMILAFALEIPVEYTISKHERLNFLFTEHQFKKNHLTKYPNLNSI